MNRKRILAISIILSSLLSLMLYNKVYRRLNTKSIIKKPNILLITVCSLRQDHLGCYGYSRLTTPNIDKLAQSSTIFTNCFTHIPWTKPSIYALMTGEYPFSPLDMHKNNLLTNKLHLIGYATAGVVGTFVEESDFNLNFDRFFGPRNLETSKDKNTVSAEVVSNKAIEILNSIKIKDNPMFLWVFLKDPHWPYLPPDAYKKLFLGDSQYYYQSQRLKINDNFYDSLGGIGEARLKNPGGEFIDDKSYYIAQYDAEISFADFNIGRIIDYLKETGDVKDWMIILIADHGESLGEDGYYFDHGYKLSDGLIKVPLIIKFPNQDKMEIRNELVSICDIYPTITGLLKIKNNFLKRKIYGESLLYNKSKVGIFKRIERMIMLNNSPNHENGKEVLFGCVRGEYKLIFNQTRNKNNLYSLSSPEILIEAYTEIQKKRINEMSRYISDFFIKKNRSRYDDINELRSFGYVQ